MAKGYLDTINIDWPDGIDQSYVRSLQTPSGLNVLDLARELDAALTLVNAGPDPLLAAIFAPPTSEVTADGGDDGSMTIERRGQYVLPRPQFVEGTAHHLSIGGVNIGLAFTEAALKRITMSRFRRNTAAMARALRRGFRADAMFRLTSAAEITVDPENRSTATSPGFAGSGTGGNVFKGVYPDGSAVDSTTYTLYFRDTAANRDDVVLAALEELELWHPGPIDLIGSATFVSALALLPDFVDAGSALVRPAQGDAEALVDGAVFVGVYLTRIRVYKSILDWTSDHAVLFKSYGNFNTQNPLVMRFDEIDGRGAFVRTRGMYPLSEAIASWTYGINVNNRVGAALIRIAASGDYTPPTIVG